MIRPATQSDIPALLPLLEILFNIEEDFQFDPIRQKRGLEMLLMSEGAILLLAEIDKSVVAMVTGQLVISTAEGNHSLLIEDLVVLESYRHLGIGSKLLERVGQWGDTYGANRMQLLADRNNGPALSFYSKKNWQGTELICLRKRNNTSSSDPSS